MMLHQDGSRHVWLDGQPALDLIVTLDDATGAIYTAFSRRGGRHGFDLPGAQRDIRRARAADEPLYGPRGALLPHRRDGRQDRSQPADASGPRARAARRRAYWGLFATGSRALQRAFQTLQDRLVKELRLAGITSIEAANAFIREVYLPAYNERFAAPAAEPGSAFTSIPGVDLDEILCVQEERQVGNDNCVSYRTLKLQIPESPLRPHFVKARVKVHVYPDGYPCPLPRAALHRPVRREGSDPGCEKRRLNPLGGVPVEMWTTPRRCPQSQQENRTRRSGHFMCYQNRTS